MIISKKKYEADLEMQHKGGIAIGRMQIHLEQCDASMAKLSDSAFKTEDKARTCKRCGVKYEVLHFGTLPPCEDAMYTRVAPDNKMLLVDNGIGDLCPTCLDHVYKLYKLLSWAIDNQAEVERIKKLSEKKEKV